MEGPQKTIKNPNLPMAGADMGSPQNLKTKAESPDQVIIALSDLDAMLEKLDLNEDVDPKALDDAIAVQIRDVEAKKISKISNLGHEKNHEQIAAQFLMVNPNFSNNGHKELPPSHNPYQNSRKENMGKELRAIQLEEKNPHLKCFGMIDDRDPCCVNCCKVLFGLIFLPFILVYKLVVVIFEFLIDNCLSPCCKKCEKCCDSCCKWLDKCCTTLFRALEKCCNFIGKIVKTLCTPCTWVCKKIGKVIQMCCIAFIETFGKCCDNCCAAIEKCCKAVGEFIKP